MSAVENMPLDVDTLIPDGIEPVEAWRCWTLNGGELQSLNGGGLGATWMPGEVMAARCNAPAPEQYVWSVRPLGMTLEQARERAAASNVAAAASAVYFSASASPPHVYRPRVPVPNVEPPDGLGYHLDAIIHDAPHEQCSCGIYAASGEAGVPQSGNVYGKVKLWGKIVPGDKGYRAQYAYPSEFHVPAGLENDPTLKAFGVPIIVRDDVPSANPALHLHPALAFTGGVCVDPPARPSVWKQIHWATKVAVGMNLAACAGNLGLVLGHVYK